MTRLAVIATSRICDAPASLDARFSRVVLLDEGALPILDLKHLVSNPDEKPALQQVPEFNHRNDSSSVVGSNRLVVGGFFEYPNPGGRLVGFGLATGCIEEIIDMKIFTPVADAGANVLGLIEWRGKPIPVVDPSLWCGLAAGNREVSRALVIRKQKGDHLAIGIGKDVKSIPITSPHIERSTWLPIAKDRVAGVYEFSGLTVILPQFST